MPWGSAKRGEPWGICLFFLLSLLLAPQTLWSGEYTTQGGTVKKGGCRACHGWRTPVTTQRVLGAPHDGWVVSHGKAALWCLDCHIPEEPERLHTLPNSRLPSDTTEASCEVCHGRTLSAWQRGLHGKRLVGWSGERIIQACTGCHAVHAPTILPLVPHPPPRRPARGQIHG